MTDKLKQWLRNPRVWGFFASVAIMAAISLIFFAPDNFEGNSLRQADMQQGAANGQEAKAYFETTGEKALWTDALFGGMPTFQISPTYPSNSLFDWLNTVYGLGLPSPSNLMFMMMMGFFILLYAFGLQWYYALIGAVAWGFSSYFVIIIGAGHIWKFVALTYIPPTIAGLVLSYRGRYICGAALTAIFAMLQLNANHPQMSYYFAFVMAALVIAWLIEALRNKTVRRWAIATAMTLGAGVLAVGANLPSLYNTYEYSKETKRSQSELTPLPSADNSAPSSRPTGGLPREQIVGWNYGISETFTLLVPNLKGGASARPEGGSMVPMGLDRLEGGKAQAQSTAGAILPYLSQYFNDSEGTNGPVYVGALIFALFILGCFIVPGAVKWALVVMTGFSILLAWGDNFAWLTDLFIYNVPLYNKFRAVESILVIAEFTMPLLAILALHRLITTPDAGRVYLRPLLYSFGACALLCLVALGFPSAFGAAINSTDMYMSQQLTDYMTRMALSQGYSQVEAGSLAYQYSLSNPANVQVVEALRYGMVRDDALRSLMFILFGSLFLAGYLKGRVKAATALAATGLLVLFDLFQVDKRYVSHDSFVAVAADEPEFTPDAIDQLILQDTTHYRVMDIPGFNAPDRSYFHNMVGGYHAAKLNRYEDLIQRRLALVAAYGYEPALRSDSIRALYTGKERETADALAASYRVLDMLNARYIINGQGQDQAPVVQNTSAIGPAWLVGKVNYVEGADAEMKALESLDPRREAVADNRFATTLGNVNSSLAPGDTIALTSYTPNRLTYVSDCRSNAVGVFSEVWFPWGWKATIDGKDVPLGRVNYILRAMAIPAGHHEIVMTFDPESLHVTGGIAYACVSVIYMLALLAIFVEYRRRFLSRQ